MKAEDYDSQNYHQNTIRTKYFEKSRSVFAFSTILGVTRILSSSRLVPEGKTDKETPESSRLEFSEKLSANNAALADAEDSKDAQDNSSDLPLL